MNSFGLISVGLLLGIVGAALLLAIAALVYLSWQQRASITSARAAMTSAVEANTAATEKLRTELTLLMQQIDAERMYQASLGMQRSVKQLVEAANFLHKVIYASAESTQAQQQQAATLPSYSSVDLDANEATTAGIVGEEADQLAFDQYYARPARSYPPVTSMAGQSVSSSSSSASVESIRPEPQPPVQPLPDLHDAYAGEAAQADNDFAQ